MTAKAAEERTTDIRQEAVALLDEIRRHLARCLPPEGELFETATTNSVLLSIFWRSVRLFDAITLLLRNNFPEEATVLARSSFEESLWLRELGEDEARRTALIIGFVNRSVTDKEHFFRRTAASRGEKLDPKDFEGATEERRNLMAFARKNGINGPLPNFLATEVAAKKYGRQPDLWYYYASHLYVHGSDIAMAMSRKKPASNVMQLHCRTSSPLLLVGVAIVASLSLVNAFKGAAQVMGWKGAEELEALQDRFDKVQRQLK